ncbi:MULTISPECIES: hypothetical protein [Pseudoalteromonas]|uniref:Uncharacterized protein n=1 Tax=Pseudoalteromonas amylolytica TaxID=1859457 RepID=A0A1S1MV78_9GAMM|nr:MULTISPECIES: hypothetical protein [Pseudoalteromonas]OHU86192.1 hypothetical protein BFC16_15925 [Pseudoalteromonas sp. JW3]OHU89702.1 hypothetical protein BET10_16395 [Pseudoalteromonas amylolytica]
MNSDHFELLNLVKEQDETYGFYCDFDIKKATLMSQLISEGYIQGQEQSHDNGVIFSKVQITMKGISACENFGKKGSEWTLPNRLSALNISVGILGIIVTTIIALYITNG